MSPARRRPGPDVAGLLAELERHGSKRVRDGMARYGIVAESALGVPLAAIQRIAKRLGRDHRLAEALWDTGVYEARLLASYVAEPDRLTPAQMDRWCRDFDNWGICDTACFVLFDRAPHAFRKVVQWSKRRGEFERRAAFALLASLALHDKTTGDAPFADCLPLVEAAASDERNFVKKSVSWALRAVGRRSLGLHASALALARRLAASSDPSRRWVGKDALRELTGPVVAKRLAALRQRGRSRR